MEIKIEKDVKPPMDKNHFPFNKMEIGDSFTVPRSMAESLRSLANYYKSTHKEFNYKTKSEKKLIRIWRTKPC